MRLMQCWLFMQHSTAIVDVFSWQWCIDNDDSDVDSGIYNDNTSVDYNDPDVDNGADHANPIDYRNKVAMLRRSLCLLISQICLN